MEVGGHPAVQGDEREDIADVKWTIGGGGIDVAVLDGHAFDKKLRLLDAVAIRSRRVAGEGLLAGIDDGLPRAGGADHGDDQAQRTAGGVEVFALAHAGHALIGVRADAGLGAAEGFGYGFAAGTATADDVQGQAAFVR